MSGESNTWVDLSPEQEEFPQVVDYDAEELILATSPEPTDIEEDEGFTDNALRDFLGLR